MRAEPIESGCGHADGVRTAARSPRRTAGCSARSVATGAAARATGGTAHSSPLRCIHGGACDTSPAWKSNAAPTPTSSGGCRQRAHLVHPLLLARLPGADPHDRCAGGVDQLDLVLVLRRRQRAKRWRGAAGDEQPREALAQSALEQLALGLPRARRRGRSASRCAQRARRTSPSDRGRRCAWPARCPSACSAHTSGCPSGTASVAPSVAARVAGCSRADITRLTAAAVT